MAGTDVEVDSANLKVDRTAQVLETDRLKGCFVGMRENSGSRFAEDILKVRIRR